MSLPAPKASTRIGLVALLLGVIVLSLFGSLVAADRALASLREASRPYAASSGGRAALMPLIIDAVRARATVGEIADTLRASWSEYKP